jgi:hypothetical protein
MNLLNTTGLAGACLAALLLAAGPGEATTASDELRFRVMLDEQKIGYHSFRIYREGEQRKVEIDASFDVKVLFVPVYRYRHVTTEVWRNGCLAGIESETDANGDRYAVNGERTANAFALSTRAGDALVDAGCLMTFAYWNRDFLAQRQLLNAQTGEVVEVEVEALGERSLGLGDEAVSAVGYRVRSARDNVDIRVWYGRDNGRWLALESRLENGRVLRYETTQPETQVADIGSAAR